MLIVIMVGLAMGVVLATQQDLSVAGQDREQAQSLYAAEYAVAEGKAYLATAANAWSATTGWTGLLTSAVPAVKNYLCKPASTALYPANPTPGAIPDGAVNPAMPMPALPGGVWVAPAAGATPSITWQFCVRNNADDPGYLDAAHNTPVSQPNGDNTDTRDPLHLLVIEAFGAGPNGARTHLAVTVAGPPSTALSRPDCRGVQGGTAGNLGSCN